MKQKFTTYRAFWPHYLREHSKPVTRALHFFGTSLAILCLLAALALASPWYLAAAAVSGYAFAWIGHFFVERNRPATFTHPFWSLFSDFRMYFLWLAGRLAPELERANVTAVSEAGRQADAGTR